MKEAPYITYILIAANAAFSLYAFTKPLVIERYKFMVKAILQDRQWDRVITSGFLHNNYQHLFFNMLSLYFFGRAIEGAMGHWQFLVLYMGSLIFGDVLALLAHRNKPYYSAVGASGAVSGVIFAFVVIAPDATIYFFFIPMYAWIYGIVYTAISILGARTGFGNIGHEAHLGGAFGGIVILLAFYPYLFQERMWLVLGLTIPIIALGFLVYFKPEWFRKGGGGPTARPFTLIEPDKKKKDDKVTFDRNPQSALQHELDSYLDKIRRFGYDGLSAEEKKRMQELSDLIGRK